MTDLSIPPPRTWRFAVNAALAVGLALVVVAGSALPLQAAEDVRLTRPGSGARIDGPTQVQVEVDARPIEEVQWVEARLRRGGDIVGSAARLSHEGGERSGGTSTWTAQWDPASGWINGGGSLANGSYRIEARAHSELGLSEGETTPWTGHSVTVSQPAAAPELQAELRDEAVALQWSEAASPDFVRYELERGKDGGAFETLARVSQRGDTAYRDEPPGAGTWHYRVTTVRDDGEGGETSATSGTATVDIADDDDGDDPSSTPTPDESDDSGLTPSPDDDGGGTSDQGGNGDGTGDGGGASSDGQGTGGSSSERSAEPGLRQGREPPPSSGQGSVPELDGGEAEEPVADEPADDSFSTELPYDDPEGSDEREAEIAEADTPQNPGVITVGDEEFALERALPPMAGGLLLFVTAGHILRLRQRLG